MTRTIFGNSRLAILLGLSLGIASFAAAEQTKDEKAAKAAPAQPRMIMTKDPVTGKLRPPTAEEQAELNKKTAAAKAKATAGKPATSTNPNTNPKMIKGPGGSVGMVLDDDSTVYSVATRGADKKISTREVTGKTAAVKAVQTPAKKVETKQSDGNEK